jgi:hypothetical protein
MTTEIDLASETWKAIAARTTARLADLRSRNDSALDEVKTAHLRGRISELKELLALGTPVPADMANETQAPFA